MTTFYLEIRMINSTGCYWTVGINFEAESFTEAVKLFNMWAFGIETVSSLTAFLCNISNSPTRERSYFNVSSAKAMFLELSSFMNEE